MTTVEIFQSDLDCCYYFWLGDSIRGPFNEYMEAHVAMSEQLKEMRGKEKETTN